MPNSQDLEAAGELLLNYATLLEIKAILRAAGAPETVIARIKEVDDVLEWLTPERRAQLHALEWLTPERRAQFDKMSGDARWWNDLKTRMKGASGWIVGTAAVVSIGMQLWNWLAPLAGNHP